MSKRYKDTIVDVIRDRLKKGGNMKKLISGLLTAIIFIGLMIVLASTAWLKLPIKSANETIDKSINNDTCPDLNRIPNYVLHISEFRKELVEFEKKIDSIFVKEKIRPLKEKMVKYFKLHTMVSRDCVFDYIPLQRHNEYKDIPAIEPKYDIALRTESDENILNEIEKKLPFIANKSYGYSGKNWRSEDITGDKRIFNIEKRIIELYRERIRKKITLLIKKGKGDVIDRCYRLLQSPYMVKTWGEEAIVLEKIIEDIKECENNDKY